jgi:inorganic pyrophosphatase
VPGIGGAADHRARAGHRHDDHDRFREEDHKIIAIATGDPEFDHYWEANELPPHKLAMVHRFFLDYKKLEGKSVQVEKIEPAKTAYPLIEKALEEYKNEDEKGSAAQEVTKT